MNGTLFLVATPIGNFGDLSPRGREILASVDRIAAEDTRVALKLLRVLGIKPPPLTSYHDHNEDKRSDALVGRLLAGERIALVSDAGTPLISDPGYRLVQRAIAAGVPIVVLPGPCAAVAALGASGLPPDRFVFVGFLPREPGARDALLTQRAHERATLVLYEAPHRLAATVEAMIAVWGDRPAAAVRDLTKSSEQWHRGPLRGVVAGLFGDDTPRGEITLVVGGFAGAPDAADAQRLDQLVDALVAAGVSVPVVRDVVSAVYARPRRDIYQRALAARGAPAPAGAAEPEEEP